MEEKGKLGATIYCVVSIWDDTQDVDIGSKDEGECIF